MTHIDRFGESELDPDDIPIRILEDVLIHYSNTVTTPLEAYMA